jgi:elongator complex protein 3
MATEIMTMPVVTKKSKPKGLNLPPENERFMLACSDIANALIHDHEAQSDGAKPRKDINLNSLKSQMAKKHSLKNIPPLTAIIAAIPEHYKKYILPKLIAKPIRESPRPV